MRRRRMRSERRRIMRSERRRMRAAGEGRGQSGVGGAIAPLGVLIPHTS